jgi:hypothetical protein
MTHDDNGGGWGLLAGSSVAIVQVFALFPGFLALLLITAPFVVVLLLPAIPFALLAGAFYVVRAAVRATARTWGRRSGSPLPIRYPNPR